MACLNDDEFGPLVAGCRDDFDFTKSFEQLILSIVPNVLFIIIAATCIAKLTKTVATRDAPKLRLLKALVTWALFALNGAYLYFQAIRAGYGGRHDVLAASLATASAAILIPHSRLSHARMKRPSDSITVFLLASVIFDAVQLRTHWLSSAPSPVTGLFAAITASTCVLLVLELTSKTKATRIQSFSESKRDSSSALSKVFLWWLNDLIRYAYGHEIVPDDLYPLDEDLAADKYRNRFTNRYRALQSSRSDHGSRTRGWTVARAIIWALGTSCVAPALPRLTMSAFAFAHPFFISSMLENLAKIESYLSAGTAVAYVGIILFLNVGNAMATSTYGYYQERTVAQVRACLVPALYQSTLQKKVYSEKSSSVLSMMNSEMNMIQFGVKTAHEFWICVLEIILASWLLKRRIGWAFLAPLAVVLLSASASTISGRFTSKKQGAWMEALGSRVGLTSSVLSNLPSIKMAGLGNQIGRVVQMSREIEIQLGNRFRFLNVASAIISFVPIIFCPIVTFTVARKSLTMSEVMTSLAFINLLSNPMILILQSVPHVMAAITSVGRIEEFIDSETDNEEASAYRDEAENIESAQMIELANASFGWHDNDWSLQDINLKVSPGGFSYLVGPVAAGKTTLCLGLLDETKYAKGQVKVHRGKQLSYCSQDVFIINGSIRENIIGIGGLFNASLYEKVVKSCQLQADFESLANGDETIVGSSGAALSGGQKKRISLARSLYAEPEVAIFDDVLSGVDSHTAQNIAVEVFGPNGFLRKIHTTVIFASQSTEFVDYFDEALILKNGKATWSGPTSCLPADQRSQGAISATQRPVEANLAENRDNHDIVKRQKLTAKPSSGTMPMVPPGHSDDYSFYSSAVGPWTLITFFLLALTATFLFSFSTLWLEIWMAAEEDSSKEQLYFHTFWALQVTCVLAMLVFFTHLSTVMGPKASSKLHFDALKTIVLAPLDYYTTVDSSVPTGYISQDMNIIDSQFTQSVGNTVATALITVFQFVLIAIGSPSVLFGYPFFSFILFRVQRVFVRTAVQLRAIAMEGRNPLIKHFKETLDGLVTIRAFGWVESNIDLNTELLDKSQRSVYLSAMLQIWLKLMLNLCIALVSSVFVAIASQLPASTGLVGVALVTFMSTGEMLGNVIQAYTALQTSAVALNRLKFLQDEVPREDQPEKNLCPPKLWPATGVVQLDEVCAAYKTSKAYPGKEVSLVEAEDPGDALKAVSLRVDKGENILICGRTGSGKSSLLLLLQGFINPHTGSVKVDGIAPSAVDRNKLRDGIIALPQFPFFLTSEYTVRDNLEHHFSSAELSLQDIQNNQQGAPQDEDCIYALQTVGIWDTLSARGGLDAALKEGSLSRGQKQLFSLARAILRQRLKRRASQGTASEDGGLLLLDEFNTGLDATTESLMWEVIKTEFASCTIICVAHRLGAASDFDHVVVLSHGRVVEEGVPAVLLEDSSSKFRAIWHMKEI